jgi:lipoic acid synthetase
MTESVLKHPSWIRGKLSWDKNFNESRDLIRELNLKSVCVEAACPNKGECWSNRHITFLILGDICTRGCCFCNISFGEPRMPDKKEPSNIVKAVERMGSKYVVITSVTRDDLADGGAGHFIQTVKLLKEHNNSIKVELLIPDFNADSALIGKIALSGADVIGHNIEMPQPLYACIRPRSDYRLSLKTLKLLSGQKKENGFLTKSSMILGLGEQYQDILATFEDLRRADVDILYLGQYLNPSGKNSPVLKYYTPEEFELLKKKAEGCNFKTVCSGPMVRSSFRAEQAYNSAMSRS